MISDLVIFGATGDVAKRYVFPALSHLVSHGRLPNGLTIIGVGRRPWTTPQFQEYVSEVLGTHRPSIPPDSRLELLPFLKYHQVKDLKSPAHLKRIFSHSLGACIMYLGLPPCLFGSVLTALEDVKIPKASRIILEKPFGLSYAEAEALNRILDKRFSEESIFRMDHFLGKPTVENILNLRFEKQPFERIWQRQYINKVEIVWDETLALEGRGAYYDRAGALKDMVQNHLLQMMVLLTMEPAPLESERAFRDQRVELLRSIRKMSMTDIQKFTLRARYRSGTIGGKDIPDYVSEEGVVPERETETFARVTLRIDNARWQNVPFVLQSGKAMEKDTKEIRILFQKTPLGILTPELAEPPNLLRFNLENETIDLEFSPRKGQGGGHTIPLALNGSMPPSDLPPYARLFLEVLSGNPTRFIRNDEAEEMWKVVQPIVDGWQEGWVPLQHYRAGSNGPRATKGPIKAYHGMPT
ncbi:MAG: glucose-6-phosphate dehydrogenase [Nitrospirales bacterium]|nr:glucose-6-phosphate dehydrogenase [Nitrospirales bacterium]